MKEQIELYKALSLERHLDSPETVQEDIVHDANKVGIPGAFGVAKAFTMGAILGQSYGPLTSPRQLEGI